MPILINDNTARVQYTATSGQTVFAVPFEFFENSDLKVYRNSTLQTITTHYTLTGAGVTGGGNLTFVSGVTLNDIITIVRDIPIKRVTDFPLSGPFNIAALNLQLDQLTAMVQEVNTLVTTRVPLLAEFDQPSAFSALPTRANRANNYFVFDSNGNPAVASSALAVTDFTQAGTGAVLRTAQDKMRERRTVLDYGAATDGVTNARAAFVSADAVGPFVVSEGNYLISSSITIANDVTFEPNGVLIIPNGVTVTFTGHVSAGIDQIFSCTGTGAVVFNPIKNYEGYSEWWGAVTDNSTGGVPAANSLAINAAIVALGKVQLMPSDYYISATIKHNTANGWLCGAGGKWNSPNGLRATRIVMMDGSTNVLQIGPDSNPGSIGLFRQGIKVTGIFVTRAVAPVISSACASVLMQFVLEAYCEDVAAYDSMDSWKFNGTVHCIINRCAAHRVLAGTGGTDSWKGFNVIGTSGIAAGGNASLYLSYCHADDNRTSVVNGIGFYADGKFTDCFWIECETVSCTVGMQVIGNGAVTNDFGSNDLMILHSINDAFKVYGIEIKDLGVSANVEVVAPYCGPGVAATAAMRIANAYGVVVTGGQMVMGVATAASAAIRIENSVACVIDNTLISEATLASVVVDACTACTIAPVIKNSTVSGAEAVYIFGATVATKFEATVTGKASAFTYGYRVNGTADARNEYNCTGINSAAISGGAANKLIRNGASITAAFTLTDTNTTSGVMT